MYFLQYSNSELVYFPQKPYSGPNIDKNKKKHGNV